LAKRGYCPETVGVNFSALQFKGSADVDREVVAILNKWGIAPGKIENRTNRIVLMDNHAASKATASSRLAPARRADSNRRFRQPAIRRSITCELFDQPHKNRAGNSCPRRHRFTQRNRCSRRHSACARTRHRNHRRRLETEGQGKFLLSAGCEHAQGYYFSRPVTAARATELLRTGTIKQVTGRCGCADHSSLALFGCEQSRGLFKSHDGQVGRHCDGGRLSSAAARSAHSVSAEMARFLLDAWLPNMCAHRQKSR